MDFNNFPCSNLIAKCDLSSWFNSHYSLCNKLAYENDKMNSRYIYIYMYIWYEPVFQYEGRGFIRSYLFRTVKVASLYATNLTKHIRYCCNLHLVILVMASSEHSSFWKADNYFLVKNLLSYYTPAPPKGGILDSPWCLSVRPSVCPSVCPSVRPSVRL